MISINNTIFPNELHKEILAHITDVKTWSCSSQVCKHWHAASAIFWEKLTGMSQPGLFSTTFLADRHIKTKEELVERFKTFIDAHDLTENHEMACYYPFMPTFFKTCAFLKLTLGPDIEACNRSKVFLYVGDMKNSMMDGVMIQPGVEIDFKTQDAKIKVKWNQFGGRAVGYAKYVESRVINILEAKIGKLEEIDDDSEFWNSLS